ncbi:unnamed protein product [Knipowitschia caucasica]
MNVPHSLQPQMSRPGSARVIITEHGSGHINPTPTPRPCEELEPYLTPETLELLCGTQDLSEVTSLEMCVNLHNTLGNFGKYLPKLEQLKMNNSVIRSIRDIGSSLSRLQVLWMPCCSLEDLDGISSLSTLKELYLAYNKVSELSQVGMLENLHILDLEGNDVDDLVQIQFLGLCTKLQNVTLDGNPICKSPSPLEPQTPDYCYRAAVRELIPQLRYLDNMRVEEEGLSSSSTMGEDLETLQNSIRCSSFTHLDTDYTGRTSPLSRPPSAWRPSTSLSYVRPGSSQSPRPHTGSRPPTATGLFSPSGSRPASSDSGLSTEDAESSSLTHGSAKILFCGNPAQAIRARREKLQTAPTTSAFTPRELPIHVPEHTYDVEDPGENSRCDVFADLRVWRREHSRRLEAIKTEKRPQILTIQHGDEEDNEEEDCFDGLQNSSSDEEDEMCCGDQDSSDSLLQSPSPDMDDSSDAILLPSPPTTSASQTSRKAPGIRTRRLLKASTELLAADYNSTCHIAEVSVNDMKEEIQHTDSKVKLPSLTPQPPPRKGMIHGSMLSCADKLIPCAAPDNKPRVSKVVDRAPHRPRTANAALQKHHQHRVSEASRGSSQPD